MLQDMKQGTYAAVTITVILKTTWLIDKSKIDKRALKLSPGITNRLPFSLKKVRISRLTELMSFETH